MTRELVTEFLGTFFLLVAILWSVLSEFPYPPLFFGSVLTILVYLGGPISGAHYNPAVTLGMWKRGVFPARRIIPYVVVQILAVFAAVVLVNKGFNLQAIASPVSKLPLECFLGELIGTFLLCWVIFYVATIDKTKGNWYYGLAIGGIVAFGALLFGEWSGALFNPSTAIACYLSDLSTLYDIALAIPVILLTGVASAWMFNRLIGY